MEETQTTTQETPKKSGMGKVVLGLVLVAILAGGFFYFLSTQSKKPEDMQMSDMVSPTSTQQQSVTTPTVTGALGTTDSSKSAVTVNIEAGSFYYKPAVITVKKDQPVNIVMHSVSMMHNFNIDELNVHGPLIKNGDTQTITFTPDKVGTFEYYCSVGNHRAMGQTGKINVE